MQLPKIAAFPANKRFEAIQEIRRYLIPGAQKTRGPGGGLLTALGSQVKDNPLKLQAETYPTPYIAAAGISIPKGKSTWVNFLSRATYNVSPTQATTLNVVLIHHQSLKADETSSVYGRIRQMFNNLNGKYRFPSKPFATVSAGDNEKHWGAVEKFLSKKAPPNVFFIDFCKPRQASDKAYSVIKCIFAKNGFLSQFVSFKTCNHSFLRSDRDEKKSTTILGGVARQVMCKCGEAIWWVTVPKSLPLPAMFVGVDVYHCPRKYDPETRKKSAKNSCAAVVIQVVRKDGPAIECYSQTYVRKMGEEFNLGDPIETTIKNAMKLIKVQPKSCIVWRDGMSDGSIETHAAQEVDAIRRAFRGSGGSVTGASATPAAAKKGGAAGKKKKKKPKGSSSAAAAMGMIAKSTAPAPKVASSQQVALSYVCVQKRIATKFIAEKGAEKVAPPTGTVVVGLEDLKHRTFFITGTAPPFSMPKPTRFTIVERDDGLGGTSMTELTWDHCHGYMNWPASIE